MTVIDCNTDFVVFIPSPATSSRLYAETLGDMVYASSTLKGSYQDEDGWGFLRTGFSYGSVL